mmetsp:Transcript_16801/g.20524  ORF Transcript_16801/g.20524 Transcript_16801/m.20524 type:complete len:170 (+) Transcript_16801:337-846(+)
MPKTVTLEQVWEVIMDFDNYPNWNPFHKRVRILQPRKKKKSPPIGKSSNEDNRDDVFIEMNTKLFGIQREKVFYVDEERHIFIYGAPNYDSFRAQWLTIDELDGRVFYHSVLCFKGGKIIGMTFAKIPFVSRLMTKWFTSQHKALGEYMIQDKDGKGIIQYDKFEDEKN